MVICKYNIRNCYFVKMASSQRSLQYLFWGNTILNITNGTNMNENPRITDIE